MIDELAQRQLDGLVVKAGEDFDSDVEIYGGPVRLGTRLVQDGNVATLAAVATDEYGAQKVYVWLPSAGTSGVWYERADLSPEYVSGLIAWGESRESRRED